MRYIDIEYLKSVFDDLHGVGKFNEWEIKAKEHAHKVLLLAPSDRAKYWAANNIWSTLYSALSAISGHKCWYTESKENSSEWQVDHFRPKGKSLDHDGKVILQHGYWWLSYYWKNFRLSGSLTNLLRKDRFINDDEVLGKGNFFPIKDSSKFARENDLRCRGEIAMLIDPIKSRDITLISFDQNGTVFPTFNADDDLHNNTRATLSIKCYGLEHSPLRRGRKRVWDECESIVELTQSDLAAYIDDDELIDTVLEECFQRLARLAARDQPHSMVVFNYVREKLNDAEYVWLKEAQIAIA